MALILILLLASIASAQTNPQGPMIVLPDPAATSSPFGAGFASPVGLGANLVFTLPAADGSSGDCLQTDGSKNLTFGSCGTGTGYWAPVSTINGPGLVTSYSLIGIGTTGPATGTFPNGMLHVSGVGFVYFDRYSVNGVGFFMRHASGTIASPTAVSNGQDLGKYLFSGYDGTTFMPATAQIRALINGTVSTGHIPTDITFDLGPNGSPLEAMRIRSDRSVQIAGGALGGGYPTGSLGIAGKYYGDGSSLTGVLTNISATDIVGLFSGCSGVKYLGADRSCHDPGTTVPAGVVGGDTLFWNTGTHTWTAGKLPVWALQASGSTGGVILWDSVSSIWAPGHLSLSNIGYSGAAAGDVPVWSGAAWVPRPGLPSSGLTNSMLLWNGSDWISSLMYPYNLDRQGATTGQVLQWNGAAWTPGTVSGGGGGGLPGGSSAGDTLLWSGSAWGVGHLPLGSLTSSGATFGQVPTWNGSSWAPTTPAGGGGTGLPAGTTSGEALLWDGSAWAARAIHLADITQGAATTGQVATWNGSSWVPATTSGALPLTGSPGDALVWNGASWVAGTPSITVADISDFFSTMASLTIDPANLNSAGSIRVSHYYLSGFSPATQLYACFDTGGELISSSAPCI